MIQPVEPVLVSNLLKLAEAFRIATGRESLRQVSRLVHGDAPAFDKLKSGDGSMGLAKYDECMSFLADPKNWPEGSTIPQVVDPKHKQESRDGEKQRKEGGKAKGREETQGRRAKTSGGKTRPKVGRRGTGVRAARH